MTLQTDKEYCWFDEMPVSLDAFAGLVGVERKEGETDEDLRQRIKQASMGLRGGDL